ncbi:MAG: hypothetical protein JRJ49_09620 [Deltaproteobacteria bacterium]|nr:hypothetical protein [Deltaproteobacteria bacterium]
MPLFKISENNLSSIGQKNFELEKNLQILIEKNLKTVFNCRFVASEFSTGNQHNGRIDTLALSEDNNPVIVEYKKIESSELINQSLFYLYWLQDHKGDFEIAVQKILGNSIKIDWSDIRVICIAPNYKKYDLHAVQVMGANIELWKYRLFTNNILYFEEVLHTSKIISGSETSNKNPVMVEAGKKASITRATAIYTFDEHIEGKPDHIKEIVYKIREFIMGLDTSIEEIPKKYYVAYKISQNIVCMNIQGQLINLFLKLEASEVLNPPEFYKNMHQTGHQGTGDAKFAISSETEFEEVKPFIELAYNKVGG